MIGKSYGVLKVFPLSSITPVEFKLGKTQGIFFVPENIQSAVSLLVNGRYKDFIDKYVEANLCAYIHNWCRNNGPRILVSISEIDDKHLEFYTECIDLELLMQIVFGQARRVYSFERGFRDLVPYMRTIIDVSTLEKISTDSPSISASYRRTRYPNHITLKELFEELIAENFQGEVIIGVPCFSRDTLNTLASYVLQLRDLGADVLVLTRYPEDAYSMCKSDLGKYVIEYLEALDDASKLGIDMCNAQVTHIDVILNRMISFLSYDVHLSLLTRLIAEQSDEFTKFRVGGYLYQCLCSGRAVWRSAWRVGSI